MSATTAVSTTSEELVSTPFGPVQKSKVHAVPDGARINHTSTDVQIIAADGSIIHTTPVPDKLSTSTVSSALANGNAAWTSWTNTSANYIAKFSTTWTVPPMPEKRDGVLYICNALMTESDAVLYPVLQFGYTGAGGGQYWAISCWYFPGDHIYFSKLVPVEPGQSITGDISFKNAFPSGSETIYNWNAMFSMVPSTSLNVSISEVLKHAFETLQIYYVSDSSALPAGYTIMGSINLALADGSHPSAINWTPGMNAAQGFGAEVISNSATNGAVKLIYSDSVNV